MYKLFSYLDRFYIKENKMPTLCQSAIQLYRKYLFDRLEDDIYEEVNKLIKDDRNCDLHDLHSRNKIKIILQIISDIDIQKPKIIKENNKIFWVLEDRVDDNYEKIYQDKWYYNHFRNDTIKFAKEKGYMDIQKMYAPDYISEQLKYLEEEKIRQAEYINIKYHHLINEINYQYLIGENSQELSKKEMGISDMFNNEEKEQLKNTYQLFKLYPACFEMISSIFVAYIKTRGEKIVENIEINKDPLKLIPELINLRNEMDDLIKECFENKVFFHDKKNKSFSLFMNKEKYGKQLSNYLDFCMRKGFKGKFQNEIDNTLKDIINLYKCLNLKYIFWTEANKNLSDRLIKNMSLSINYEKSFISQLKQEADVSYVNKMVEMMNDLDQNKIEMDEYKLSSSKGIPNNIQFNIQIISNNGWEINRIYTENFILPKFLSLCMEDFQNFYLKKYANKKLIWYLGLSKVEIQYLYLYKQNISVSTLPQFLTLLQLEKHKKLTIGQISECLGCHVSTIKNDICGLVFNQNYNPKCTAENGVIKGNFDVETKEFKETDLIEINENFFVDKAKFSTIPIIKRRTAAEMKELENFEANINKKYEENILQVTITRIMKSRIGQKTTHKWLFDETSNQIELFKPQPQQIKENIEKLIEKNIITRSKDDRNCYEYIA